MRSWERKGSPRRPREAHKRGVRGWRDTLACYGDYGIEVEVPGAEMGCSRKDTVGLAVGDGR